MGTGWYLYVYLNRSDWQFLQGLGAAVASTTLCWWLTPALGYAIGCAVASHLITYYVIKYSAPPPGYCAEFKFAWAGLGTLPPVGYTWVYRNC